ncbi:hypothetical protein [Leisingera sp. ANG-DT]|uniref:hypothetical protein n=1 Tax=Leisingera sp. ANG-DT TaxID=1577897 RepID=UPI00126A39DF|nr:hypothetical protein [Leisingera sp. ANG-DT]
MEEYGSKCTPSTSNTVNEAGPPGNDATDSDHQQFMQDCPEAFTALEAIISAFVDLGFEASAGHHAQHAVRKDRRINSLAKKFSRNAT